MTNLTARIAIDPKTLQKVQILRGVRYGGFDEIGSLVRFLVDDAWQEALNAALVSERMLSTLRPEQTVEKKGKKK
ncbi:MAG: hypothetical protein HY867_06305 [Chloroflexi bacterium]|nr:hypothetical protein [Chloroflexota bacterium]